MKKNSVQKPSGRRSSHDLSCQSLTTTNLFSIKPIFQREVVPNDHFNIKTSQINRVDALPVSSFVSISNRLAWFYVKHCQVWKPWDSFINKVPYAFNGMNNLVTETPYVTPLDLYALFSSGSPFGLTTSFTITQAVQTYDDIVREYNDSHIYDFIYYVYDPSHSSITQCLGLKLTYVGRLVYDILFSLGYRIPKIVTNTYTYQTSSLRTVHMSLLPLMSYLSVLLNYYVPVKFRDYSFVNSFSYQIDPYSYHFSDFNYFNTSAAQQTSVISFWSNVIQMLCEVFYGSDYFTDSLVTPYRGGNISMNLTTTITDPAIDNSNVAATDYFASPGIHSTINTSGSSTDQLITPYVINALKAITSKDQLAAMTYNDVVGASLALFGVKPEASDMVPFLLSNKKYNIYVSPEVATADTYSVDASGNASGAPLGYKAGRGEGTLTDYKTNFDFDAYGSLMCITSITPDSFIYDGLNREMMYTKHGVVFDPNMVGLGYQAVGNIEVQTKELYRTQVDSLTDTFGFQNSFAELGYKRDFVGGDFCIQSRNQGLDAFHFGREVVIENVVNDARFALAKSASGQPFTQVGDGDQFSRIFIDTNAQNDHFQQWTIFEINADRDIPYNGEFTIGDDLDGKVQEVGRPSEVLNS